MDPSLLIGPNRSDAKPLPSVGDPHVDLLENNGLKTFQRDWFDYRPTEKK
jgi:hypothetical protein